MTGRAAASFIGGDEVSPNLKDLVSNSHLLECRVRFIDLLELFLRALLQRRAMCESIRMPDLHQLAIRLDDLGQRRSGFELQSGQPDFTLCHMRCWRYLSHHATCFTNARALTVTEGARSGQCGAKSQELPRNGSSGPLAGVQVGVVRP